MARLYDDFVDGTTGADINSTDTSLSSAGLADLVVVAGADYVYITLDADGSVGAPEIVKVTSHTAAASSATIARGQLGTTARSHLAGTDWAASVYQSDFERLDTLDSQVAALGVTDTSLDSRLDAIEANDWVTQARIGAAEVGSTELQDSAVTTAKIAALAVTDAKLAADSVTTAKILDSNVTLAKMADASVGTAELVDASVTQAKTAPVSVSRWSTSTNLSVPDTTEQTVTWTTEAEDDLSLAAPSFTTITLPVGSGGLWGVSLVLVADGSFGSAGYVHARVDTTTLYRYAGVITSASTYGFTWAIPLADGATIRFDVGNVSGGARNITSASLVMTRIAKLA